MDLYPVQLVRINEPFRLVRPSPGVIENAGIFREIDRAEHVPRLFRYPAERAFIQTKVAEREDLFGIVLFQVCADAFFLPVIIVAEYMDGSGQLFPIAAIAKFFIDFVAVVTIKGGFSGGLSQAVSDAPEEFFLWPSVKRATDSIVLMISFMRPRSATS
jgi:hypothetical protein